MAVSRSGIPHAIRTDGTAVEVLPRAYLSGTVFRQVEAVLGVAGGVVLGGTMDVGPEPTLTTVPEVHRVNRTNVAAHYDFDTRRVRVYELPLPSRARVSWHAYGDLNCIALRVQDASGRRIALDLDTEERYLSGDGAGSGSARAATAWHRAASENSPPHHLPINQSGRPGLRQAGYSLSVTDADPPWDTFTPLSDGEPILNREKVAAAQLAGPVLALGLVGPHGRHSLLVCRGPSGAVTSYGLPVDFLFALSPRGDRLAYRRDNGTIHVADAASAAQDLAVAGPARLHTGVRLSLNEAPFELIIGVGNLDHRFTVEGGKLAHRRAARAGVPAPGRPDERLRKLIGYDASRFVLTEVVTGGRLVAVPDGLGQVLLTTRTGDIVAAFLIHRKKVVAWLPGGVFWGDPSLIGDGPSPDADARIGRAILEHVGETASRAL
ncbi:MAG TPA: hypothetical protein VM597_02450 [Gemmataceae bacterium]|nr:hypothetical protein [Gemmataceae bacterium]